jgi:hypothetical protein
MVKICSHKDEVDEWALDPERYPECTFVLFLFFGLIVYFCFFYTAGHGSFDHKPAPPPSPPVTCDASVRDASLICIGD